MTSPAPYPPAAFIDSSAYFALAIPRDQHHADAMVIQQNLVQQRVRLLTTNLILGETYTLLLARVNRAVAYTAASTLRASGTLSIERVTERDEARAWEIIGQYGDKRFSFVDATSFAVMERRTISAAFAFDDDFRQYGWQVLSP